VADPDRVRVGIVGSGYIAGAHSAAFRTVAGTYPDVPRHIDLVATADVDAGRAEALASAWGWSRSTTDWRQVTRADDVDLVDICVPNAFHAEVACDALAHGKHVICEKPLANTADNALAMATAARDAGRVAQVCFYYRLWPAISWAAQLVASGELGRVRHFRGWMLQDYAADPAHDLGWRARLVESGAGALGDLGSHIIDIARHLCGEITSVSATTRELVDRVVPTPGVDDLVSMIVDFDGGPDAGGAGGVIEASWALRGHKCDLGFDLVCDAGAVRFSWERFNQVDVLTGDVSDPINGYRSVLIGGGQPDVGRFVAVPGQGMGYRDAFTIGVSRALTAIARGEHDTAPSFVDGLQVALTVEAAKQSAAERRWAPVPDARALVGQR
jgi:predicted dehydrogenase